MRAYRVNSLLNVLIMLLADRGGRLLAGIAGLIPPERMGVSSLVLVCDA